MDKRGILIGLAGGTGSGKTSVARALTEQFGHPEVLLIEQDAYYCDLSHLSYEKRCENNFDHPDSIDFSLLKKQLREVLAGKFIEVPIYDFKTHTRTKQTTRMDFHHVIVLEGIFALYDAEIRDMMDIKIYVDTPDDIRVLRRLARDISVRGRTLDSVVKQYEQTVRPMHLQFVEPSKRFADIIIPEGAENKVAVDLIQTKMKSLLKQAQRAGSEA